jgi:hypothetical protein
MGLTKIFCVIGVGLNITVTYSPPPLEGWTKDLWNKPAGDIMSHGQKVQQTNCHMVITFLRPIVTGSKGLMDQLS